MGSRCWIAVRSRSDLPLEIPAGRRAQEKDSSIRTVRANGMQLSSYLRTPSLWSRKLSAATKMAQVKIVEVGPRDGLQNISQVVSTRTKIELIRKLAQTGLHNIEATSFVSPKWIPQLADGAQVLKGIQSLVTSHPEIQFPVLVPNVKGLEKSRQNGAKEVAVFVSATEGFSKKNINCSVAESLNRVRQVTEQAQQMGIRVRG